MWHVPVITPDPETLKSVSRGMSPLTSVELCEHMTLLSSLR